MLKQKLALTSDRPPVIWWISNVQEEVTPLCTYHYRPSYIFTLMWSVQLMEITFVGRETQIYKKQITETEVIYS